KVSRGARSARMTAGRPAARGASLPVVAASRSVAKSSFQNEPCVAKDILKGALRRNERAEPLEASANRGCLRRIGFHERQPRTADLVAEQVQRRLDGDRVRHDLEDVVRR